MAEAGIFGRKNVNFYNRIMLALSFILTIYKSM